MSRLKQRIREPLIRTSWDLQAAESSPKVVSGDVRWITPLNLYGAAGICWAGDESIKQYLDFFIGNINLTYKIPWKNDIFTYTWMVDLILLLLKCVDKYTKTTFPWESYEQTSAFTPPIFGPEKCPRLDASEIMTNHRKLGMAFWCPDIQQLDVKRFMHTRSRHFCSQKWSFFPIFPARWWGTLHQPVFLLVKWRLPSPKLAENRPGRKRKDLSSNHQFSGTMLVCFFRVFWGSDGQLCWWLFCWILEMARKNRITSRWPDLGCFLSKHWMGPYQK